MPKPPPIVIIQRVVEGAHRDIVKAYASITAPGLLAVEVVINPLAEEREVREAIRKVVLEGLLGHMAGMQSEITIRRMKS